MADWQTVVNMYWPYLLGAGVIGLIIGWFLTWLVSRNRSQAYEARIRDLDSKASKARQELSEANSKVQALQNDLKESQATSAKTRTDLTDLQQQKATVDSHLQQYRQQYAGLRNKLEKVQEEGAQAAEALQADIDALTAEKEGLLVDVEALGVEKAELQASVEQLQGELDQVRGVAEANAKAVVSKDNALNEAYERAVILQREVQERQKMLVSLQSELDTAKVDLSTLSSRNTELDDRLHRARGDVAGEMALVTTTMIKMKDEALNQANARIAVLTKELETLRAAAKSGG
jgi:chromosome segregation ATPase